MTPTLSKVMLKLNISRKSSRHLSPHRECVWFIRLMLSKVVLCASPRAIADAPS